MNVDELRQLDFNNMADAPASVRYFLVVVVFIAILIVGYFLRVKGQVETLDRERATEQTLRDEFEDKAKRAINLPAYEQQLAEMEALLRALIRQLPSKTEMPDLLVDVSQTALAAGITNELFEPGSETIQGFYAEQPISIRMVGTYHQFGTFISGVASLPRVVILTMHDISLQPAGSESAGQLAMEGTVKTYRYLDEDELAEADPAAQGGR
ncbi:MAG: type 4a pilus biogenesis protein PilO [Xanthomonadales bacterium]|nr:type 4a pilus biogenesis protein PilO [Xanthomonadales bacterium]